MNAEKIEIKKKLLFFSKTIYDLLSIRVTEKVDGQFMRKSLENVKALLEDGKIRSSCTAQRPHFSL